jgi:hypothetical protein
MSSIKLVMQASSKPRQVVVQVSSEPRPFPTTQDMETM